MHDATFVILFCILNNVYKVRKDTHLNDKTHSTQIGLNKEYTRSTSNEQNAHFSYIILGFRAFAQLLLSVRVVVKIVFSVFLYLGWVKFIYDGSICNNTHYIHINFTLRTYPVSMN